MAKGNRRHNYHQSPKMHPGAEARGWKRRVWCMLDDEEWREFREYADRDCLPMGTVIRRGILDYIQVCRGHYREMNEVENAAVGGDENV